MIHRSLRRCSFAGFIGDEHYNNIFVQNLLEFLLHGIRYAFPVQPGRVVRGIATAHSARPLNEIIVSEKDIYVWPSANGDLRGQAIEPLDSRVPEMVRQDQRLYELLSLIDALRVGRVREKVLAGELLTAILYSLQTRGIVRQGD